MEKEKEFKRENLVNGQILIYTGKGFIGYNKDNNLMKFIRIDESSRFYIWVEYIGISRTMDLPVGMHEVKSV